MTDYRPLSITDRIKTAVSELTAGGTAKNKAQSLVALSVIESAVLWTVVRKVPPLYYDAACYPNRVLVGLELGEPIYKRDSDGNIIRDAANNPVTDVSLIRDSAAHDADAVAWLTSQNLIKPLDQSKVQYVKVQTAPFYTVTGGLAGIGTEEMAQFFEWVLDQRKGALLNNFSIGPTMMWMAYSGPGAEAGTAKQADTQWPQTWDDIFAFYTSNTTPAVISHITYLDQVRTGMSFYPADDPTNETQIVKWLSYHTGSMSWAQTYYDGHYKNALQLVLSNT